MTDPPAATMHELMLVTLRSRKASGNDGTVTIEYSPLAVLSTTQPVGRQESPELPVRTNTTDPEERRTMLPDVSGIAVGLAANELTVVESAAVVGGGVVVSGGGAGLDVVGITGSGILVVGTGSGILAAVVMTMVERQ